MRVKNCCRRRMVMKNRMNRIYEERDYGRITKGACLALKSRILLYAASPLFNGGMSTLQYRNQDNLAERIKAAGYPTADNTRWQRAADAAKAVMNSGVLSVGGRQQHQPGKWFLFPVFNQEKF